MSDSSGEENEAASPSLAATRSRRDNAGKRSEIGGNEGLKQDQFYLDPEARARMI